MSLEVVIAGFLWLSLLLFALAGGADFGGGMWTLLARGERKEEQARLVDRALGPIWEVNELWIIVAVVILWTSFTDAFVAYGIALFVPLTLVLAGILVRGAFLVFQEQAEYSPTQRAFEIFGRIFGAVSFVSPFFFGMTAGAIASGDLRVEDEQPLTGYFDPWLGPFPLVVGLLALATCAYLAAVYLTLEARGSPPLQELFRRRGIASGATLGVLGLIVLPITYSYAPYMWRGIVQLPGLAFMAIAAFALVASVVLLYWRRFWWARTAAIAQVVAVFGAWASAQYPYLIVPDVTIFSAASPRSVLVAMLILSVFYVIVLGPALALLFSLFKRHPASGGEGER